MHGALTDVVGLHPRWTAESGAVHVGRIVDLTTDGRALVDFPGNQIGPVEARSAVTAPSTEDGNRHEDLPVLLLLENGDPNLPIIIGFVRDTFLAPPTSKEEVPPAERQDTLDLDGTNMVLEAKEQIVLRCGRSSVTLRRDGKIVIKGTELVSRASRSNRIKGGSVAIN